MVTQEKEQRYFGAWSSKLVLLLGKTFLCLEIQRVEFIARFVVPYYLDGNISFPFKLHQDLHARVSVLSQVRVTCRIQPHRVPTGSTFLSLSDEDPRFSNIRP